AKVRGYKPGRFSFNVRGGRCETCKGDGQIKIEMHFLPDVYVPCETCKGARYNRETLEVRFKGKSIADVLEMSVEEALQFFAKIPKLRRRLQTLHDVGLDYVKLGQPATTLSGGEAQRVKPSSEVSARADAHTRSEEKAWFLRALLVLQDPRPVFAALRDDSDEVAETRQDAAGAIVWLAGIAAVLATTVASKLLDDVEMDASLVAVWAFFAGGLYGFGLYLVVGKVFHVALRRLGGRGSFRRARHVLAFAG